MAPHKLKNTEISVTVDGLESLRSEYTFENITDTTKGYTRKYGRITFTGSLQAGQSVIITYNKSQSFYRHRIELIFIIIPGTGMFGNDLGQLLDGVDYGGVEVSSYSLVLAQVGIPDAWFLHYIRYV